MHSVLLERACAVSFRHTQTRFSYATSRCGSVTLGGKQRTVLFSNTLVPLRYSLRLGHTQGLTVHRTVIQYLRAASLPRTVGNAEY